MASYKVKDRAAREHSGMNFRLFPNTPGIYQIVNTINQKRYVGYATNLRLRCKCHRVELRASEHKNGHIQNAWNSYGERAFEFIVLQECEQSKLRYWEDYWAKIYKVHDREYGYNIQPTDPIGEYIPMAEETKRKISLASQLRRPKKIKEVIVKIKVIREKKKRLYKKRIRVTKKVYIPKEKVYKVINIVTGEKYLTTKEVAVLTDIKPLTLSRMLIGKYTNTTDYRYLDKEGNIFQVRTEKKKKVVAQETRNKISIWNKLHPRNMTGENNPSFGKKQTEEHKRKRIETFNRIDLKSIHREKRGKRVIDNTTGKIYRSVGDLAEEINIPKYELCRRLSGQRKNNTSYNYITK